MPGLALVSHCHYHSALCIVQNASRLLAYVKKLSGKVVAVCNSVESIADATMMNICNVDKLKSMLAEHMNVAMSYML